MLEQQLQPGLYDYPESAVSRVVQPVASETTDADGVTRFVTNRARWKPTSVRTNYIRRSEELSSSPWTGTTIRTLAAEEFAPGVPFWTVAKSSTVTQEYFGAAADTSLTAGESLTCTVALLAGSDNKVAVGLYYNSSWGAVGESTFNVISGPGTTTSSNGALILVNNLDPSIPTLIRITRTAVAAVASPMMYIYPGTHTSTTTGASVKVGRVMVEKGLTYGDYIKSGLYATSVASGLRLVVEREATNLVLQSNNLGASPWLALNCTRSTGPAGLDGVTPSTTLTVPAAGASYVYQTPNVGADQREIWVHAKAGVGGILVMRIDSPAQTVVVFNLSTGTITSGSGTIVPLPNGWFRCGISTSLAIVNIVLRPAEVVGNSVHIDHVQIEPGAEVTSRIRTTTAAVTRPADQVFVRAAYPQGATPDVRRINGAFYLVEAFFTQGTQRWTNWPMDVEWEGQTYRGLGQLGSVSELQESEGGVGGKVTLRLSPVDVGVLSLAVGNVEGYRGKPVNVYAWPIDNRYRRVGQPILRHFGVMDQVSVKQDGDSGVIELICLPGGTNGIRKSGGQRVSAANQKLVDPTDQGLEYAQGLVNTPQLWLSKKFQEI